MYRYLRPVRMLIIGVGILSLINVIGALLVPTFTADLVNKGVIQGDITSLEEAALHMILASIVTIVSAFGSIYLSSLVSAKVSKHMRSNIIRRLQELSLTQFKEYGAGTILMRSTRDVEKVQSVLSEGLVLVVPTPLIILVGLGLTFSKDVYLGSFILSLILIMIMIVKVIENKAIPLVQSLQKRLDSLTDLVRDHLIGMAVIRAFNRSRYEEKRQQSEFAHKAQLGVELSRTYAVGLPSILLIFNMSTVVTLWLGAYGVLDGRIEVGDIMAVIEYATLILLHLIMAIFVLLDVPEAIICYKRIQDLLGNSKFSELKVSYECASETIQEKECMENDQLTLYHLRDRKVAVQFNQVWFRYKGAEESALKDISFTLYEGEHLAIMGDIGSGKSTLVNILMGLLPVTQGQVNVGGQNMDFEEASTIREEIGYVPQKAYLFTGTIRSNLLYGVEGIDGRSVTDEEIQDVARITKSDEFIERFPDAYDHMITQGGSNLSGGQRQRLAMARALLRKPKLYIFDDSFSAMDGQTEAVVRQALREELHTRKDAAIISIEQKVISAKCADKIMVIQEGSITGFGTHEELLKSSVAYQQIVASQEVDT